MSKKVTFAGIDEIMEDNGNQLRLAKLEKLEESAFAEAPNASKVAKIDSQKSTVDDTKVS
jgi:hypothetical protein